MKLYWNREAAAWDDLAAQTEGRTYTHGAAWLEAAACASHGTWGVALAAFDSSRLAFLPVVVPGREGFGPRLAFSGALGGYGGLLSTEPLTTEQVDAVYAAVRRTHPDLGVRGNPRMGAEARPYLPGPHTGFQVLTQETRLAQRRALPAEAPHGADEFWWVPGPQEFHADLIGRLEDDGTGHRPRAFYYHLFRRAQADTLGLAVLKRGAVVVAAVLVGRSDDWAFTLAAHSLCRDPAPLKRLMAQLPGRLWPEVTHLDLGVDFPLSALPGGWATVARPVPTLRRFSVPTQMLATLRPVPLEAS